MRRTFLLLVTALVTALGAGATVAYATAPTHERVSVDDTFTWDDCGFVVEEHVEGDLLFISWFDASGARTRELVAAPRLRVTWTNPATGASFSSPNPFVVHKSDNPDGSVTVAFTGLVFAIPGGGRAHVESGRTVILFSNGNAEVLSDVGPSADLCEALDAALG